MKLSNLAQKGLSFVMAFAMTAGMLPVSAVEDTTSSASIPFYPVDIETGIRETGSMTADEAKAAAAVSYADEDIVRVSIILEGDAVLEHYSSQGIAANAAAVSSRAALEAEQKALTAVIEKEVLNGEKLDVVWNLTLAANLISANVKYGEIEAIRALEGVRNVVIENRYSAPEVIEGTDEPNMYSAGDMTGSPTAWASGYTGIGQAVAIIDTGVDTDHQSLNPQAYVYSITQEAEKEGKTYEEFAEEKGILDKDDIAAVLGQLNVLQKDPDLTADDLYINEKVPFGYNYIDISLDVTHDNDTMGSHGSHVTGIAAANKYIPSDNGYANALETVYVQGQAPDAQILAMKVFGNGGGAYDSDYMAAIEDAVVLDAAAANLSLGSRYAGFSYSEEYQEVMDNLEGTDTVVVMSAGNNYDFMHYGVHQKNLYIDDISLATGGSPGTFDNAFTTASVNNVGATGDCLLMGEEMIFYVNGSSAQNEPFRSLAAEEDTEYEYVAVEGFGASEFAELAEILEGRIAVCQRGGISFYVKANNAVAAGAAATLVYNNTDGTVTMNLDGYTYTNPVASITQEAGNMFIANGEKKELNGVTYYTGKVTVAATARASKGDPDAPLVMSDFSSWGITQALTLTPEITTPGGGIYSLDGVTVSGDAYEVMSGTSMAAPQNTGMSAVVRQYIEENGLAEKAGIPIRSLVQSLLMGTAKPITDAASGSYYALAKQGAGLADVGAAVNAKSYILMDESATASAADGKVKAELGDDPDKTGVYTVRFTLNNMTDAAASYSLDASVFTQGMITDDSGHVLLDLSTVPLDANVQFKVDGEVYSANGSIEADVDRDGDTDYDDVICILQFSTIKATMGGYNYDRAAGDIDHDGYNGSYDAHLLLKALEESAINVPANGTVEIEATITLTDRAKAQLDENYPSGAYIQSYLFVSPTASGDGAYEEGVQSIPVLAFYGSWGTASMYETATYVEFRNDMPYQGISNYYHYAYLDKLPYTMNRLFSYISSSDYTYMCSYLAVDGYLYSINPFAVEATPPYEYAAITSGSHFDEFSYENIRNSSFVAGYIEDGDGNIIYATDVNHWSIARFYHADYDTWLEYGDDFGLYYFGGKEVSFSGFDLKEQGLEEGDRLRLVLAALPEYYTRDAEEFTVDDGKALVDSGLVDGCVQSFDFVIDDTAPELLDIELIQSLTDGAKSLRVKASDNEQIAGVVALYYDARGRLQELARIVPDKAEKGGMQEAEFDLDGHEVEEIIIAVGDYAGNETDVVLSEMLQQQLTDGAYTPLEAENIQPAAADDSSISFFDGSLNSVDFEDLSYEEEPNTVYFEVTVDHETNAMVMVDFDNTILHYEGIELPQKYSDSYFFNGLRMFIAFASVEPVTGSIGRIKFSYAPEMHGQTTYISTSIVELGEEKLIYLDENHSITLPGARYDVTVTAGEHGSVSPSGTFRATIDQRISVTAMPDEYYAVDKAVVNGEEVNVKDNRFDFYVTGDMNVDVSFKTADYTVTATAGEGGSIDPAGEAVYQALSEAVYTVKADELYDIDKVTVNGEPVEIGEDGSFKVLVDSDKVIEAAFRLKQYSITAEAGEHGTIDPAGTFKADVNSEVVFTVTPDDLYDIDKVLVNGEEAQVNEDGTVTVTVTGDMTVTASFVNSVYTVTAAAGYNGRIEPSGSFSASSFDEIAFTLTADEGYMIETLLVNGSEVDVSDSRYVLTVAGDTDLKAFFTIDPDYVKPQEPEDSVDVKVTVVGEGSVTPMRFVQVKKGDEITLKTFASYGHVLESITINGDAVEPVRDTTVITIEDDTEITVTFRILHIEFYDEHWWENGEIQGQYGDPQNITDSTYNIERGREIYDPATNAWYWLDAVFGGKPAKNKEVWMPYLFQKDLETGANPEGKWVRYDAAGAMIKGWYTVEGDQVDLYPAQAGNTYYYDLLTGAMLKGEQTIDGRTYQFDEVTGVLAN